jgi:hypothetical protein
MQQVAKIQYSYVCGLKKNIFTTSDLHNKNLILKFRSFRWEYTGCGKLTSFFEYEMPYEKGS